MATYIRRREFIFTLGGAAAAWPRTASGQQPSNIPTIGYLSTGSPEADVALTAAFRQGLTETGYVQGQNIAIEYRWAHGQYDQLPALAADLVRRQVAVIATIGGTPPALAAKAATRAIPVVFYLGVDPVQFGLVASLNRPGGNMTGVAGLQTDLATKRIELLHELVPKAAVVALLVNPTNPYTESEARAVDNGARSLGLQVHTLPASTVSDIDAAFGALAELRAGALLVTGDLFFLRRREQLVALAARQAIPAMYPYREFVEAGGMACYAPSLIDGFRLVGVYTGRILKGANPADLPVQQVVKVELIINLRTSRTLGLTVPLPLLGRADEVIE